MIIKVIRKLKVWIRLFNNYFVNKSKCRGNKYEANCPSVFFILSDINQEPYYYPIIFSFHQAGYNIFLKDKIRFIGHSFGPAKMIYDLPKIFITRRPKIKTDLWITDQIEIFKKKPGLKCILLKANAFQGKLNNEIFLPYPMHPNAYISRQFLKFDTLRKEKRKTKVLFSGNTDPIAYQNPVIRQKFKKINRVEVIEALLNHLHANELLTIRSNKDQALIPKDYFNGLLLYLWKWSPLHSEGLEIRVDNHQWHEFLARGDFFMCCPGVVIPQSHNAIEAMAVGTIPVLQYQELFHPALEHGVNCIVFLDEVDLIQKIRLCIEMTDTEIASLRRNVIDYYEKWLSHYEPCRIIERLPEGAHEIYFYNEAKK